MEPSQYPHWIPGALAAIEGKPATQQVEILLARLAKIAYVIDTATAREISSITGDSLENCQEIIKF